MPSAARAAVKSAYYSRVGPDWYNDELEELPSGHGFADIVYLPKRYARIPALVVELKWDKPVDSALDQIRSRNYPKVLQDYGGPVLLVG